MALIVCPECKSQISETVSSCPQCGYQLTPEKISEIKEKRSKLQNKNRQAFKILGISAVIFCGIVILFALNSESADVASKSSKILIKPEIRIFKQGEPVRIGYTSYKVTKTWWATRLNSSVKPDAMFLMVGLSVSNKDTKARAIPPLYLVDQLGREYETSSKGWVMKGTITSLDSLNPNVEKTGGIVFDVPKDNIYKLKVSGGYWSDEIAFIELFPEEKR